MYIKIKYYNGRIQLTMHQKYVYNGKQNCVRNKELREARTYNYGGKQNMRKTQPRAEDHMLYTT